MGDGEEIRLFCQEFLSHPDQSDVLGKLATSGADERHAVIIATQGQLGLHTAVDMGLTPSQAPTLGRCIDWLWVIASQNLPARGCYWTRRRAWRTAGHCCVGRSRMAGDWSGDCTPHDLCLRRLPVPA